MALYSDVGMFAQIFGYQCICTYFSYERVYLFKGRYMNKSKKSGKDQESIQSITTSDPGYHMGK